MKIAILNDTHCGVRNSSDIFIKYQERFYDEVFFPYLKEHGIKNILHLGDYYDHRKYVNFKALNSNRKHFLNVLRREGIHMDIIPGNHDVFYKNTNELNSLKELLGHYMNEIDIHMEPKSLDYDGCSIAVIPWINNENYAQTMDFISKCKSSIVAGHFELEGFEMYKGFKNPHGMSSKPFERFELVMSGHFHTKSQEGVINYLGSQMEFTWTDAHDQKYFHIFDTEDRSLTSVKNPITIFSKIYYDDSNRDYTDFNIDSITNKFVKVVVVKKTDLFMFDKFIDKLQLADTYEVKIAETFEEFSGDSVVDEEVDIEDTQEMLDSYVEAVETDLSKEKIKSIVKSLYVEAQNMELM
jgi:DNA repair exonuclease SbcCD nuclease subunit